MRIYYRKPGGRKIRTRGPAGSADFLEDYQAAVTGRLKQRPQRRTIGEGSLRWCASAIQSAAFRGLEPVTQRVRRAILETVVREGRREAFRQDAAVHIRRRRDIEWIDQKPANAMVKALRQLYKFAIEDEIVDRNHAGRCCLPEGQSGRLPRMTLKEIEAYEDRHPVGSKARLALALLLYTAQRGRRSPLRATACGGDRRRALARIPAEQETGTASRSTSALRSSTSCSGFSMLRSLGEEDVSRLRVRPPLRVGDLVLQPASRSGAGTPGSGNCAPHGLRQGGGFADAELGCPDRQIMSINGHTTSKEIDRYTRGARQRTIAGSAGAKLSGPQKSHQKTQKSRVGQIPALTRCNQTRIKMNGAKGRNRTTDTAIFSRMLYQTELLGRVRTDPGGSFRSVAPYSQAPCACPPPCGASSKKRRTTRLALPRLWQ